MNHFGFLIFKIIHIYEWGLLLKFLPLKENLSISF